MRICISEENPVITAKIYSASILAGCDPEITCINPDYTIHVGENNIIIQKKGFEEKIGWINDKDVKIRLNKRVGKRFLHTLYGDNKEVLEAYITDREIDPLIFTGLYTCILYKENNRSRAFIESCTTLSLGAGSLSKYSEKIRSEHRCIHRLVQAINRLIDKDLLAKIDFKELLLTCRGVSDNVYLVNITKLSHTYIVDFPRIINTRLEPMVSNHPLNKSLLCGLNEEILSRIPIEMKNIIVFNGEKCLCMNDPVRIVILLEKTLI